MKIFRLQSRDWGNVSGLVDGSEFRIALAHLSECQAIGALFKSNGDFSNAEIKINLRLSTSTENHRCPQRWMPGKWQLFFHGKDANLSSPLALNRSFARKNERCLRKVCFFRE